MGNVGGMGKKIDVEVKREQNMGSVTKKSRLEEYKVNKHMGTP